MQAAILVDVGQIDYHVGDEAMGHAAVAALQARGYSDEDLGKILGGNLLRVWSAVEAGSARPRD